jgi:hypothetical protein
MVCAGMGEEPLKRLSLRAVGAASALKAGVNERFVRRGH